jgi:hypothetical protein
MIQTHVIKEAEIVWNAYKINFEYRIKASQIVTWFISWQSTLNPQTFVSRLVSPGP